MISATLFLAPLLLLQQAAPVLQDPTYKELSKLVGGDWVGHFDANTTIHQHFEFDVDGRMIRGHGFVTSGSRTVLFMQPNLGWDPVARQVSYVDFHNHDTVFLGHVTLKDGWFNYDFHEFADPSKHYSAKSRIVDKSHYEFILGPEVISMERTKS